MSGYSRERSSPSEAAHKAAESLDNVYENLADGISLTDLKSIPHAKNVLEYLFETGLSKGEAISRAIQVLSLVERDNALLANVDWQVATKNQE